MHITFSECCVRYGETIALHPTSIKLAGQRLGVIGLNGSGKTSFSRLINGLTLPNEGRVVVNGIDTTTDPELARRQTGFVFQNPQNQLIMPVVIDDLIFGLKARGFSNTDAQSKAYAALARFGVEELAKRRVHELSGGELHLVAIASVWVLQPRILILDEPTNQLDLRNRRRVVEAIHSVEEDVIVVTHDLDLAAQMPRVLLFHDGRIAGDGPPDRVIAQYRELAAC